MSGFLPKPSLPTLNSGLSLSYRLSGLYTMHEGSASNLVHDISGKDDDGTISGGVTSSGSPYGYGLDLNGSNGYVNCGFTKTAYRGGVSVSAVAKVNSFSDYYAIVAKCIFSNWVQGFGLSFVGTDLTFWVDSWNGNQSFITAPALGEWFHVVGTYDKNLPTNQVNIYLNGIKGTPDSYSSDISSNSDTQNLQIGRGYQNTRYLDGSVACVALWDRGLSEQEASLLYHDPFIMCRNDNISDWLAGSFAGSGAYPWLKTRINPGILVR
jgi:hypothetical protein